MGDISPLLGCYCLFISFRLVTLSSIKRLKPDIQRDNVCDTAAGKYSVGRMRLNVQTARAATNSDKYNLSSGDRYVFNPRSKLNIRQ